MIFIVQLSGLDTNSMGSVDVILPERELLGSTKAASSMTTIDITQLKKAMYLQHVVGNFHAALAQFLDGTISMLCFKKGKIA